MEKNFELKKERDRIEKEIRELHSKISKINDAHDKDNKLSWTRDDEIAELDREIEKKQSRLKEIYEALGE